MIVTEFQIGYMWWLLNLFTNILGMLLTEII